MSKRNWHRTFVSGLALGLILAFFTFAAIEWPQDPANQAISSVAEQASGGDAGHYEQANSPNWGALRNWALSSEGDTVAQWIMALFAFIAAGLLWSTFLATRKMATDTREIGEAQVRAYLTIEDAKFTPEVSQEHVVWHISVKIRNTGQSPARGITAKAIVKHRNCTPTTNIIPDLSGGGYETRTLRVHQNSDDLWFKYGSDTKVVLMVSVVLTFRDIFGDNREPTKEIADFFGAFELIGGESVVLNRSGRTGVDV